MGEEEAGCEAVEQWSIDSLRLACVTMPNRNDGNHVVE